MSKWFKFKTAVPSSGGFTWIRADTITAVKDRAKGHEAQITADGLDYFVESAAEIVVQQLIRQDQYGYRGELEFPGTYDAPEAKEKGTDE